GVAVGVETPDGQLGDVRCACARRERGEPLRVQVPRSEGDELDAHVGVLSLELLDGRQSAHPRPEGYRPLGRAATDEREGRRQQGYHEKPVGSLAFSVHLVLLRELWSSTRHLPPVRLSGPSPHYSLSTR